jgi:deoxycytidylate deaminase
MSNVVRLHSSLAAGISAEDAACSVLALVEDARRLSTDRSTRTAAALVSPRGRVLSVKHNGLPEGVANLPERHIFYEHAERRVLYDCAANGWATRGSVLYSSHFPCDDCGRAAVECKIAEVVVNAALVDVGLVTRFFAKMRDASDILCDGGVAVRMFNPVVHGESRAGMAPRARQALLGDHDPWHGLKESIACFWDGKDPGDEALPARRALADAADFVRMYGYAQDNAATWESDGRVTALWRAGHACAVARFPGDGTAEWAIFAGRVVFGDGPIEDCLSALAAAPGLEPAGASPAIMRMR